MPQVSVIVPVYNAEKYLSECVDSILAQTLRDIEVILVDDGSTDNSPAICDAYQSRDERIKVIHQQNKGISAARNAGIRIASGKYIAFVDSDDFVDCKMYACMLHLAESENVPLVICTGFYSSDKHTNRISKKSSSEIERTSSEELVNKWLWSTDEKTVLFTVVWNKLYLKKFFSKELSFKDIRIHEDEEFSTRLYLKDYKIAFVDQPFYYYRANQQSITYKPFTQKNLVTLDILCSRYQVYKENGWNQSSKKAAKNFCEIYIEYSIRAIRAGHREWTTSYRKQFNDMRTCLGLHRHIKDQIRYTIFSLSPRIYIRITQRRKG